MSRPRVALLALLVLLAVVPVAHALTTTTNPFTLGQAPDWLDEVHTASPMPRSRAAMSRSSARPFAEPGARA